MVKLDKINESVLVVVIGSVSVSVKDKTGNTLSQDQYKTYSFQKFVEELLEKAKTL